ncbi:MAG: DNA repair protein RecN [gamma proteobacterium symbiont of Ctena orbiculata]|uniref:DNA repair protein RecN n=1 Tax=Candidatus Thiodiazotropha taylori TaxID=2792791 RepID=A0A944QUZ3_9GAMM|nr:DNA repair protein RecN [Candidatus Thiodiazotropha taylori]MBV2137376.1 DNA repair protein RecN [Candidatus Thiodiazotropha taylori]PUB87408.1 MAG: DNA repair protein RecN [gamma proteobacterium symbiont of Ctena orbiculata]PVV07672.1 MAG: DNA repair protein RecN [gamma proteobacterium symbiont of Ctena orbiculata]PVV12155.1 MAG: DNA repair protein RecN [gamma proteobacterium symbiont of Ctena orbiculata]
MLTEIQIRNLAIVSSLELELLDGLTALTGETGAGKSILIDALGLALGDRADNSMIRTESERAEVTAVFDLRGLPAAADWLRQQELDEADECILRRSLSQQGRSKAFINGRAVPLQQLQELGNHLVEIHGQHAHQSLLKSGQQRDLLDAYGGARDLAKQVKGHYRGYQADRQRLETLAASAADRASRLDLLNFQAHELQELHFTADEWTSLEQEQRRLSHQEQLADTCRSVINGLDEEQLALRSRLSSYVEQLNEVAQLDERLNEPQQMLDSALIQVDETLSLLRDYLNSMELDSSDLQQVEERLGAILDIARKYRVKPEQLADKQSEIEEELTLLQHSDDELDELNQLVDRQRTIYLESARALSGKRQDAAERLGGEISEAMQKLGMPGGRFSVSLHALEEERAGANGLEQVEFMVSANPGMPLQPLSKVASGGELSRISLAIQVATIRCGSTPTLVFDEVDVGIGGGVAEIVGQMLRTLAGNRQILCVTHLPQVASQAMHHFQVQKTTEKKRTWTAIAKLQEQERIQEIARMLGGVRITEQTLAHAEEMINLASSPN